MTGRTLGRVFIGVIWSLLAVVFLSISAELILDARWKERRQLRESGLPRHDALMKAYHPFSIQYINPTYLFFFPFDPAERVALSNDHVTLDSAGFRGPGPEFAGDRQLAFLVGGSTAFSYSSADSTSITGYLNRLQDRYFFVNAGVPSWNSTQEVFRLVHQILDYEPSLILTFDGANDMAILVQQHVRDLEYPPGTPESFHTLQELVADIRAGPSSEKRGLFERLLPRLSKSIRAKLTDDPVVGPIPGDRIEATATKYVANTNVMNTLTEAGGGRFVSIFQPIIWLHENGPAFESDYKYRSEYRRYHSLVFADTSAKYERHDFASMFDDQFEEIPYLDPSGATDLSEEAVFVDPVHVFDRGNRLIATKIVEEILSPSRVDSTP